MPSPWLEIGVIPDDAAAHAWSAVRGHRLAEACDGGIVSVEDAGIFFRAFFYSTTLAASAYIDAGSIVENSQSNYSGHSPIGRFEPTRTHITNANRTVAFRVQLMASGEGADDPVTSVEREVTSPALWLDALALPTRYGGRYHLPPPSVYLRIGDIIRMRGIVTTCSIEWGGGLQVESGVVRGHTVGYMSATVDLVITSSALSYADQFTGVTRGQAI